MERALARLPDLRQIGLLIFEGLVMDKVERQGELLWTTEDLQRVAHGVLGIS